LYYSLFFNAKVPIAKENPIKLDSWISYLWSCLKINNPIFSYSYEYVK
jgi:hypothetical protein